MAKVSVYDMSGKQVGDIELSDNVFGVEVNEHLIKLAVTGYLANKRQGTQSAKTRSEVSGGGRKPWRQKGTGHARQGSTRAPQWVHGGVVFAPKPRDYAVKMNKKEKAAAFRSVLTARVQDEKLMVLDALKLDEIKTKKFAEMIDALKVENSALVVYTGENQNAVLSARNLANVKTVSAEQVSVYDVLKYDTLILTSDAVKAIEEVYA
jgi:large subunit ribosomal protein L4